jgi:putative serine/threonine protein kinase
MELKNLKYFSKGKRSKVYTALYKNKKVIVKYTKRVEIEVKWLKFLKKLKFVPQLIDYDKEKLIYYFIDGITIEEFLKKKNKKLVLKQILKQCYELDKLKINKLELTNPYKHILIKDNKAKMIDFERCYKTKNPKNVTQFVEYLMRNKIIKREVIPLVKEYKKKRTKTSFEKILELVSS